MSAPQQASAFNNQIPPRYTIKNITAAYTVTGADYGVILNCTGTTSYTLGTAPASSVGAGFNVWIWNQTTTDAMAVTIDPNSTETIDGMATLILRQGEGTQIVCDGTNWQTGAKKTMRGYAENISSTLSRPTASGTASIAVGQGAVASGNGSFALGGTTNYTGLTTASGIGSLAIAGGTAGSSYSTAIGVNGSSNTGSVTATGAGAMALGGSYASGTDSFAAANANNSSYGARGANSVAIGYIAYASAATSVALNQSTASGSNSFALGYLATASGSGSIAISGPGIGWTCSATAQASVAIGDGARSTIIGKYAYTNGAFAALGDSQTGTLILRAATTNATATVATSDSSAAAINNQVILPNNSAFVFTGTVVAKQSGSTNVAAWKIEGVIVRGTTAASTTLVASTVTAISNVPGWTLALSADTTNGGLTVTVTGAASTNIRWVATAQTSEVTYA